MLATIQKDAETRMKKSIEALSHELQKVRTGRAHPSLLESIKVSYYGNETPLSQMANIVAEDSRTLTVTPWEKNLISTVEKAIRMSDLGLNPVTAGTTIRVPLPALTESRRKDLIKHVKVEVEHAKVAVRNIRRDANAHAKELLKDKKIREDEEHKAEEHIQKLTDKCIIEIDKVFAQKESELMQI